MPSYIPGHNVLPVALADETRSHVPTACAAYWLNRSPQTLRSWACFENGPVRPIRINGRLAWPVGAIVRLLSGQT
jgi:hypothetical protein